MVCFVRLCYCNGQKTLPYESVVDGDLEIKVFARGWRGLMRSGKYTSHTVSMACDVLFGLLLCISIVYKRIYGR